MTKAIQLIHIPAVSETLTWRFHRQRLQRVTLFEALLDWNRKLALDGSVVVVTHSPQEFDSLAQVAESYGAICLLKPPTPTAGIISQVLAETGGSCLEFIRFTSMLLPDSLRVQLRKHHEELRSDFTEASNVPEATSPLLFSVNMTQMLGTLPISGEISFSQLFQNLREAAGANALGEDDLPARGVTFDFVTHYACPREELPWTIYLDRPDEIQLAIRLFEARSQATADSEVLSLLRTYKRDISKLLQSRFAFARPASSGNSRSSGRSTGKPVKVLYVANRSAYSGAEECFLRMVEGFQSSDVAARSVIACSGLFSRRMADLGVHTTVLEFALHEPKIATVNYFDEVLAEERPDVVHLNGDVGQAILLSVARTRIPLVPLPSKIGVAPKIRC
jgi:hypothetical protein